MLLFFSAMPIQADEEVMLKIQSSSGTYQGKVLALGKRNLWLMQQDGQLKFLSLGKVEQSVRLPEPFRPWKSTELRSALLREFPGYTVESTGHYVVCAEQGKAKQYARIFEEIYRSFRSYFSVRGFEVPEPSVPLVAIIFPNHADFARYAREDGIVPFPGLLGYYLRTTNRVALYHESSAKVSPRLPLSSSYSNQMRKQIVNSWTGSSSMNQSVLDTMVHEATHQIAFNTGLHSRIGEYPKWVVEGMATVFESSEIQQGKKSRDPKTRINRNRFLWFQEYREKRRSEKALLHLIESDAHFSKQPLDAYAEAWAFSFFLMEKRPSHYTRYLKRIAKRDPLEPYTSKERMEDFAAIFGRDLRWLDIWFLRFMDKLAE